MTRKRYPKAIQEIAMHFHPALAPFKAAVLPLSKKLSDDSDRKYIDTLSKHFNVDYDETGSYRKKIPPSGRNRYSLLYNS